MADDTWKVDAANAAMASLADDHREYLVGFAADGTKLYTEVIWEPEGYESYTDPYAVRFPDGTVKIEWPGCYDANMEFDQADATSLAKAILEATE